jgi:hypothetical protein
MSEETKEDTLFNKLKKLFSTDVIVRNVGGKKLKIVDTDEVQYATDRNSLRDRYNRLRSSTYNLHNRDMSLSYQSARLELFRDYDVMDMDPILGSALDIYADECLVPNEFGKILAIRSSDDNIKQILENLFYDILNVEFNLFSWTRNLCKYGDFFLKLELSPEYGVYVARPLSAYEVTRIEGADPTNINYVKFQHDGLGGGSTYESFEIAHFRLISDSNFMPYGKSMIEPARRVWKQLSLMEDAMLIHRIMRAPEKRMFYIDVGNIPPNEIDGYVQKMINNTKKIPYIDEKTGDYNLRFNLNNMVEDFYLPVRGSDSGTRIETLPGMDFTGIDDLEYVRNKMMAALKIPKAFLGYEEGLSGKATLAAEDVRFSRTIGRLQRILVSELTKIAIVHLYIQGYQDASLVDFELELNNPSTIFEQEKLAIWQDKLNVAKDMMDSKLFSKSWIYHHIWDMTENEIKDVENEVVEDQKQSWRLEQITSEGEDPVAKFGTGTSGEGDGGGDEAGADAESDLPPLEETFEKSLEEPVTEDDVLDEKKERDQTGNKKKYSSTWVKTRGEDILGRLENKAKTTSNPIKHKFRGNSPLAMSEVDFKKMLVKIKHPAASKQIISEVEGVLEESDMIAEDMRGNY